MGPTLNEAVNRAAGGLPEGYEIRLCIENGAAWVDLSLNEGEVHVDLCPDDTLAEQINTLVDYAQNHEPTTQLSTPHKTMTRTHTYATLAVDAATIEDIRACLRESVGEDDLNNHYTTYDGGTILPGVALIPKVRPEFPGFVKDPHGTVLRHVGGGRYYRDAGMWTVITALSEKGEVVATDNSGILIYVNGVVLTPATREEWLKDNDGYIKEGQ